ncbi:MAG: hypothetical protein DRN27_04950 [Thermoplasmata archaeon]|nr:MAG: hypothetical protein DRN27_04950 [Thermoplasmata archaeon]
MSSINKISQKQFYKSTTPGIYINSGQPGAGRKTSGFINYVIEDSKTDKKNKVKVFGFFSANHKHLNEVSLKLIQKRIEHVHLEGWSRFCLNKDDPDYIEMYNTIAKPKDTLCKKCPDKDSCDYINQFIMMNGETIKVILGPLEMLFIPSIIEKVDELFIDESVTKTTFHNIGHTEQQYDKFEKEISNHSTIDGIGVILDGFDAVLNEFRYQVLNQCTIFKKIDLDVFQEYDDSTFCDSESKTIIRNGEYVTHIETIDIISILDMMKKMGHNHFLSDFNHLCQKARNGISQALINGGIRSSVVKHYIDFMGEINAFKYLKELKSDKITIVINEKIMEIKGKPNSKEKFGFVDNDTLFLKINDERYLTSKIGVSYSSQKLGDIPSWFTFGEPFIDTVFDIAKMKPVKILDSSYNETCFNKLFKKYQKEVNASIIEPDIKKNHESIIYNIELQKGPSNFSKSTLGIQNGKVLPDGMYAKKIKPQLRELIKNLKNGGKTIAMVTLQELVPDWTGLLGEDMVVYYGNLRGSNRLEDADILIILGTMFHPVKSIFFNYVLTFHELQNNIEAKYDGQRFDGYQDQNLNEFFKATVMEETYQALHRIRPLLHDKIIINLARIPQKILDNKECTIKNCTFDEISTSLLGFKKYYMKHPDKARKFIAKVISYDFKQINKIIKESIVLDGVSIVWELSLADTLEIIDNAFEPIQSQILKLLESWKKKQPLLNDVVKSIHNKSKKARKRTGKKLITVDKSGFTRTEIHIAISLLEKKKQITIEEVSLNELYSHTKMGKGILLKLKKME